MLDLLTIVLVLLVKSGMAADDPDLAVALGDGSEHAVVIVLGPGGIEVDGQFVVGLIGRGAEARLAESDRDGRIIRPLARALDERAALARRVAEIGGGEGRRSVRLEGDPGLPFGLVRDVMFTAGRAGFGDFRFVVSPAQTTPDD